MSYLGQHQSFIFVSLREIDSDDYLLVFCLLNGLRQGEMAYDFEWLYTSIQNLDLLFLIRDIMFPGMGKGMLVGSHVMSLQFSVYLFVYPQPWSLYFSAV